MKVLLQGFLRILGGVRPGLATRGAVEQGTHFIFTGDRILTYNDQICISYPFETDFKCTVPASEFYGILSGIEDEEVDVEVEGDRLFIEAKGMKACLVVSFSEEIIDLVNALGLSGLKWSELPRNFLRGISFCLFSVSQDLTERFLSCIYVNGKDVVSSDDLRISHYEMEAGISFPFLLPGTSAIELVKFEVKRFCVGEAWIYFITDEGVVFCSRIIKGDYPDWSGNFDFQGVKFQLPRGLRRSIENVSVLADGEFDIEKRIDVEIGGGKIRCRGERDIGWIENELEMEGGEGVRFSINPLFFAKILERSTYMVHGEGRALFRTGFFRHLLSLRMDE